MTAPHRIDVHHHFYPPELIAALAHARGPLQAEIATWSMAKTLDEMDRNGVATAVLSVSSRVDLPAGAKVEFLRRVARACNDYAARMAADHKGRFGFFANLPVPDIAASLEELAYALDRLKADGIGLMTSYGTCWLGDPLFTPLFEEIDRRGAIVYVHPLVPDCCVDLMGYVNPALVEFPYDTGRAMLSLLFGGAFRRFPRIRWIFSHGGGTIPMLSGRIASIARFQKNAAEFAPEGTDREFLKHHYEIANATSRPAMAALRAYLPADRIMFGTDFPFVPVRQTVAGLAEAEMTAAERTAIERGNALQLLPQLGQA